jgi:hypothetical protein
MRLSFTHTPPFYRVCTLTWLAIACSAAPAPENTAGVENAITSPGALVDVSLQSRVAVVLDEIPPRERATAAAYYLAKPASFWIERAKRQLRHTTYRLTYRNFFYPSGSRRMLALPPEELWDISLQAPRARRVVTEDGHDAVQIGYAFHSTLLTDAASPGAAEPRLRRAGGVWREPFNLPLDPEFLFQRTGYACIDEDGYPIGTARSENIAYLFDQDCDVETAETASCHLTELATESCLDALANHVGRVDTDLRLERLPYDELAAKKVRYGEFSRADSPDIAALGEHLGKNWIEYRYIPADSCAIEEQCVGGPGWRRLLLFDASIKNTGAQPLVVGSTDVTSPPSVNNMFEFSECHEHFHFRHYGDFSYGAAPGDKRAFCVESTDRYYNNELTPLVHDFSCDNQGVAAGWGDTYIAGVECNWIDITDLPIAGSAISENLRFEVNPDGFLCEGQPVLDSAGNPIYDPTEFVTEQGEPVNRPRCNFAPGYAANNVATRPVTVPSEGGLVTSPCARDQTGPLRDCGFTKKGDALTCAAGSTVELRCRVAAHQPSQVLRVCDNSTKLGGIPCQYNGALSNEVITATPTAVTFACPTARDESEPGGSYSLYSAPVLATDPGVPIVCSRR